MKPVLYKIVAKDITPSERLYKRNLSWFNDNLIICCLYNSNNWMGRYVSKYLDEIKLAAKHKGFLFFWTDDPNMEEYKDLPIVIDPIYSVQSQIEHYLFCDQGVRQGIFRRLDDDHFIGWDYKDMVKSSVDITLPPVLYEKLGSVKEYGPTEDLFGTHHPINTKEEEFLPTNFSPDPNNDEHDHYFDQFSCQCERCGTVDFYKMPKELDFYDIMESEIPCARCKKDSWTISSGTIGYYLNPEYGGWHLCSVEILKGTGFCEVCKPYYVSDIENLEFRCNCGGTMKRGEL